MNWQMKWTMLNLEYETVKKLFDSGMTISEVAKACNTTRVSIMHYCDQWGYDYGKRQYITGRWDLDVNLDYEIVDPALKQLVSAIIAQAVKDYRRHYKLYESTLPEELFFRSEWFSELTIALDFDIDGEKLMKQIRMEIDEKWEREQK